VWAEAGTVFHGLGGDEMRATRSARLALAAALGLFCYSASQAQPVRGQAPGNLVPNGGFEMLGPGGPMGWRLTGQSNSAKLAEQAHSGRWAVSLASPQGEWPTLSRQIQLRPGLTYVLSFWHKAEGAGSGDAIVQLLGKEWKAEFYVKGSSAEWKQYFYLITPKASSLRLEFTNYHRKGRTFYFDDVVIDTNLAAVVSMLSPTEDDGPVETSTPTFRWKTPIPRKHFRFDLLYSRSRTFPERATVVVADLRECEEFTAWEPLEDDIWYWKLRFQYNDLRTNKTASGESNVARFRVRSDGRDHRAPQITACGPMRIEDAAAQQITVSYRDNPQGSGINPQRTVLLIDGEDVTSRATVSEEGAVYGPAQLAEAVHTGEVTIADREGNTATKKWWFIVKPRPTQGIVTWDSKKKIFLIDGKPFFPFGMYQFRTANPNPFFEYREWGFNTTQFYDGQPIPGVKAAGEAGVKCFAVHPYAGGTENERNLYNEAVPFDDPTVAPIIAQRVFEGCNLPGLFTWSICDEPDGKPLSPMRLRTLHEFVRGLDPYHPTDVVLMKYGAYYAYQDVADLVVGDVYPISTWTGSDKPDMVWDEPIHQDRAQGGDRPVLTILQHFGGKKGTSWPHVVPNEIRRFMAYLTYVHGTRGMMWYAYGCSTYDSKQFPEQWEAMKALAKEFEKLSPVLLADDAPEDVRVQVIAPPNHRDRFGNPAVHYLMKAPGDERYLIAVNAAKEPVQAAFRIAGMLRTVTEVPQGREIKLSGRQGFVDTFQGFDVHVYRLQLAGHRPAAQPEPEHPALPAPEQPAQPGTAPAPGPTSPAPAQEPKFRTWTDNTGQFKITAAFEAYRDGRVWLRKPDGSRIAVPTERLSEADQTFVLERIRTERDSSPAAEPNPTEKPE